MRLALPQPYEDLGHTADVGVRVRGATAEEALARLVLAFAALATGGAEVAAEREERVAVPGGPELAGTAVALLRELLYRLATERARPGGLRGPARRRIRRRGGNRDSGGAIPSCTPKGRT